jgi:5-methylthioribose kinase
VTAPGGTALDIEQPGQLMRYLRARGAISDAETPRIVPLRGGVSSRVVLVEGSGGTAWVLKQALSKLRVSTEWISSPERVHREALGLRCLESLCPPGTVPGLVFEDHEHHVLAMEAVPQPHEVWKNMLLAGRVDERHVRAFAELLGTIHGRAYEQRDRWADPFVDRSFFESLRLEPYYAYTAAHVSDAAAFIEDLIAVTRDTSLTFVHGDYSPKNVLVRDGALVLLDHEVSHWGDPGFDVGFALTHLLSKAHHLPEHRPAFLTAARAFWVSYRAQLGGLPWADAVEQRAVRHTLGCLVARVAGRSPLEYLDDCERRRQLAVAAAMMASPPPTVDALVGRFGEEITWARW